MKNNTSKLTFYINIYIFMLFKILISYSGEWHWIVLKLYFQYIKIISYWWENLSNIPLHHFCTIAAADCATKDLWKHLAISLTGSVVVTLWKHLAISLTGSVVVTLWKHLAISLTGSVVVTGVCPGQCHVSQYEHASHIHACSCPGVPDLCPWPCGDLYVHRRDDCQDTHSGNTQGDVSIRWSRKAA